MLNADGAEIEVQVDKRRAMFRAYLAAEEMVSATTQQGSTAARMLDIGGAFGVHARFFRTKCPWLQVDILDVKPGMERLVYEGSYFDFSPSQPYDLLWCSHVVEHLRNPGMFFDKVYADLREGGWVGITVPPLKSDMIFQHVTLWNAGLLLIHLIHAGFDCSRAHVATYGYNVSVVVQKVSRGSKPKPQCLPAVHRKGIYFDGDIGRLNWLTDDLATISLDEALRSIEDRERELLEARSESRFFRALDKKKRARLLYFDAAMQDSYLAG